MLDPAAHPNFVGGEVIHSVGSHFAQFLAHEIVSIGFSGLA
jgi:hypothetical protein